MDIDQSSATLENNKQSNIDRTVTCPFVVPVLLHGKRAHTHCWEDTTLLEIMCLLGPSTELKGKLVFRAIFKTHSGKSASRELGRMFVSRPGKDDNKTLKSCGFRVGDELDIGDDEGGIERSGRHANSADSTGQRGGRRRQTYRANKRPANDSEDRWSRDKW